MRRLPVRSELCGWAGKRPGQTGPRSLARPHPPDRLSLYCILPPVELYCPSVELYWSPAPLCFLSWCLVAAAPPLNIRHLQHSNPLNCATVQLCAPIRSNPLRCAFKLYFSMEALLYLAQDSTCIITLSYYDTSWPIQIIWYDISSH